MGAIWVKRATLQASASECVGYKSGVALTTDQIAARLLGDDELLGHWTGDLDQTIRIRSEVYEGLVCQLLSSLGCVDPDAWAPLPAYMMRKYRRDSEQLATAFALVAIWISWLHVGPARGEVLARLHAPPDPRYVSMFGGDGERMNLLGNELSFATVEGLRPSFSTDEYVRFAATRCGHAARDMAHEVDRQGRANLHVNPWGRVRTIDWNDTIAIKDLFETERLGGSHGEFFDQRFINYLNANFEDIDKINWRKFEGLAAEWFHRAGFRVEVGPGRNDDGVDLRAWPQTAMVGAPPCLIVQCKRQRDEVGKVVVKALWADVEHEGASRGLLVTTSRVSPGAKKTIVTRSYPVEIAERGTLRTWLSEMRSPLTGVFLGE